MSASDFGGLSPKILGTKNVVFNYAILRLYCKYLRIGTRFRRMENGVANCDHPPADSLSSRPPGAFNKSYTQKHHYTKCLEESSQTFYTVGPMYRAYSLLQASNPYQCHVLLGPILLIVLIFPVLYFHALVANYRMISFTL